MRLGKALRIVMGRWGITGYRLNQVSGVSQSTLSKLVREQEQSASWDIVQKLRDGFKKIDPLVAFLFMRVLDLSDDEYPEADSPDWQWPFVDETPENIALIIEALIGLGIPREQIEAARQRHLSSTGLDLTFEELIGVEIRRIQRERLQAESPELGEATESIPISPQEAKVMEVAQKNMTRAMAAKMARKQKRKDNA